MAKLSIGSLDKPELSVDAQYNPKELQIDQPVPWAKHNIAVSKGRSVAEARAGRSKIHLEFTGAESQTITVEMLFDGVDKGASVAPRVDKLKEMARVRDPFSSDEDMRRPHRCLVAWGETVRAFRCVIDSLSVKYTMFDRDGLPLRATCIVKLKEADLMSTSAGEKEQFSGQKVRP